MAAREGLLHLPTRAADQRRIAATLDADFVARLINTQRGLAADIFREAREIYDAGAAAATAIEIDITDRDRWHADSRRRTGIASLTRGRLLP